MRASALSLFYFIMIAIGATAHSKEWTDKDFFEAYQKKKTIPLEIVHKALTGNNTTIRAYAATYLGTHGQRESAPVLIEALNDESIHVGSNYKDAGMATTRYRAYLALMELTGQNFPFQWDALKSIRSEQTSRWRDWFFKDLASPEYVRESIAEENFCQVNDDCALLPNKCPFGCSNLSNRKSLHKMTIVLNWHPSTCEYKCMSPKYFHCSNNKCLVKEP